MKKLLNAIFIIGAASLTMVACKKEPISENGIQPSAEASADPAMSSAARLRNATKTYVLTRKANDSLSYYGDGRLSKVQHSVTGYTKYSYGLNSIIAKTYIGNTLNREAVYMMDFGKGRTYESSHTVYNYVGGGVQATQKSWKYEYDSIGRIAKKINKEAPNERFVFVYYPTTVSMGRFDAFNNFIDRVEFRYYNSSALNKMNLNPEGSTLDQYLKIFGQQSKYLLSGLDVWTASVGTWTASEIFSYTYNPDGYPTQVVRIDGIGGSPNKTELFGYNIK